MIADSLPAWLWNWLGLGSAVLPTEEWTWRHTMRYGRDPAKTADDYSRYCARPRPPRL